MICQRSGVCCTTMDVIIRVGDRAKMKPGGRKCPHLISEDGINHSCAVHDEPWFKDTPCFTYGNPDIDPDFEVKRGRACPVGASAKQYGGLSALYPQATTISAEDCEDLGPWPKREE